MKKVVLLYAMSLIGISLGGCATYDDGYYGEPGFYGPDFGFFDDGGGWWGGGHHHHGGGGHGHH